MSDYSARFSKEAYKMVKSGDKGKRIDNINNSIADTGFKVDRTKSNRDILYLSNDNTNEHHIAVRGTDASSKGLKKTQDILTDLTFAVGAEQHNKHFKKKINKINKLVKQAPTDAHISLSGHSIAGGIVTEALKTKKRKRS
jgi:outer membrane protein OmpA-like peptidoglycan-associated protein